MNAPAVNHPGSLTLRRLNAGESVRDDVRAHVAGCAACQASLKAFAAEQEAFEQAVSFERFAGGVERAAREAKKAAAPRQWPQVALALAATLTLIVGAQVALSRIEPAEGTTRLKGGASVQLVVAGQGPQRTASERASVPEALAPGERVRIGLVADAWKYALVVSIDETGEVTPIYVDNGRSLAVGASKDTLWLPESLEFTGKGLERVVVVLSASPLPLEKVAEPLRLAFDDARGDLTKLGTLPLPGEQFHRTFLKP